MNEFNVDRAVEKIMRVEIRHGENPGTKLREALKEEFQNLKNTYPCYYMEMTQSSLSCIESGFKDPCTACRGKSSG